jgi:hypothetical protein
MVSRSIVAIASDISTAKVEEGSGQESQDVACNGGATGWIRRELLMARFEKECDVMPRDELEKRFVALQHIAKAALQSFSAKNRDEEIEANQEVGFALANYKRLELDLSHGD